MQNNGSDVNALILAAPDEAQGRMTFKQISWVSRVMFASGMFKNTENEAQAVVKVMAGSEMGMTPFQAMNGIDIIEGQAVVKPHTIASRIQQTGKYDYKVKTLTSLRCDIDFYRVENPKIGQKREHLGTATFTIEQAQAAGLVDPQCEVDPVKNTIVHDIRSITRYRKGGGSWEKEGCLCKDNWKNYPDDMLYARAMSRGSKRFTPDVFNIPIYTPDEIEESRDEERKKAESGEPAFDYLPTSAPAAQLPQGEPAAPVDEPPAEDDDELPEMPAAPVAPAEPEAPVNEDEFDADDPDHPDAINIPQKINDEFKKRVEDDLRDLELSSPERLRLLRKATAAVSLKSLKNDQQWLNLREAIDQLMHDRSVDEESAPDA